MQPLRLFAWVLGNMTPDLITKYAFQFVGRVYQWGGDDPISGFDCSGFVSELLRSAGVVAYDYRGTAQSIYDLVSVKGSSEMIEAGSLAFYGKSLKEITHIGYCIDGVHMIEAGGGNSETTNTANASARNAFVRLRPIRYRRDFLTAVKPIYPA